MSKSFLEDWEREVVLFIEHYHSVNGNLPDTDDIVFYINSLKKYDPIDDAAVEKFKRDFLFRESMRVRGIYMDNDLQLKKGQLSPRQMAASAAMLNFIDRRSDEKKLRDIGVTPEEWANWMLDNQFASYVAGRAEKLIANSMHDAHMGLMRGVRVGNVQAIKLYYELTDRFTPDKDSGVNVRILLGRILEAIQKHVKDAGTLNSLAIELSQIALEGQAGAGNTGVGYQIGPSSVERRAVINGKIEI